jgi:hypothetical protein
MQDFDREPLELRVPRFRRVQDWFMVRRRGGVHEIFAWANAERIVDVLHALCAQLDPAVDLCIESLRSGDVWQGELLPLPDVREVIGRLQTPLATYGGVEMTVYTPDDQLTLTPALGLVVYARSDRWVYLLEGMGFEERHEAPLPAWDADAAPLGAAPELDRALAFAVERLALESL